MKNEKIRLHAYMASCGVASRRKSEEIILAGRVSVNGVICKELGTKVSKSDLVSVDGVSLAKEEKVYYVLNKPQGYITTVKDQFERKSVLELFHKNDLVNRIFPVGRLDYDTQGVLILTNDGELSNKLTSPNSEIEKEYHVRVKGIVGISSLTKLMKGVVIDDYLTKPSIVEVIKTDKPNDSSLIKIIITEGKNRQVRKMCDAVGHPVKKLTRARFGNVSNEGLAKGEYRMLKPHEVKQLYKL